MNIVVCVLKWIHLLRLLRSYHLQEGHFSMDQAHKLGLKLNAEIHQLVKILIMSAV